MIGLFWITHYRGILSDKLGAITICLNEGIMEAQDYDPDPFYLVRIPHVYNFAGKPLKDIVHAHSQIDKEITPSHHGLDTGHLNWYPPAFIVVPTTEGGKHGLLFVYTDKTQPELPADYFFFKLKDTGNAFTMLCNVRSMVMTCEKTKVQYAISWSEGHL